MPYIPGSWIEIFMETITIYLPEETLAALTAEAEETGKDTASIAAEILSQRYAVSSGHQSDEEEDRLWWEGLTPQERAIEVAALKRSIEAADAGRVHSAKEVYARIRAKYSDTTLKST